MTIREDFEKWAAGFGLDCLRLEGEDEYLIVETRYAWSGWQAATAQRDAEIAQLRAERGLLDSVLAQVRRERDELLESLESSHKLARELRAERDALLKDAERYRWLRQFRVDSYMASGSLADLDAAIDAAMTSSSKGGK